MINLIIGGLAVGVFFLLFNYTKKEGIELNWWQRLLTILGLAYSVFVIEVIYGFLAEGEPRAALVMGLLAGIVAVIWGVLLGRFVFKKAA